MPSTTISRSYKQGQVVVVTVTFSDQSGAKARPALVISTPAFHGSLLDVIVCPISSQPRYYRRPGPGDHPLRSWQAAGLKHPSTSRVANILAIEKSLVRARLGVVSAPDLAAVKEKLSAAFGL